MSFFQTDGVTVHYQVDELGGGPALVFANSLGTDLRIWDPLLPHLSGIGRVVRYDKRGHGLTDLTQPPYSIGQLAADLKALVDHLGLDRFILAGVSIGGMIAQDFAAKHPEQVLGLVLCDTAPKIGDPAMWEARIETIGKIGLEGIADAVMERWFSPTFHRTRAVDLAGWRNLLIRTTEDGYCGCCAAIRDADLTAGTKAIAAPALVVCGEADGATPPDLVRACAALMPNARFELIAEAGHIPSLEQPAVLGAEMMRFFKETGLVR